MPDSTRSGDRPRSPYDDIPDELYESIFSFDAWFARQTKRDDPIGDLASDVALDDNWPGGAGFDDAYDYLDGTQTARECFICAYAAWLHHRDFHLHGLVYFVRRKRDNAIKIGHTRHLRGRITSYAREFGEVELLDRVPGGRVLEQSLHRRLTHLRLDGEWFRGTDEVLDVIRELTDHRHDRAATPPQ